MNDPKCPICGASLYFKNMQCGRSGEFWYCEENPTIENTDTHFIGQKNMDWRHPFDINGFLFRKNFIVRRFGERTTDQLFLEERGAVFGTYPTFLVYKRIALEHPFDTFIRMNPFSSSSFALEFYLYQDMTLGEITEEFLQDYEIME